MSTNATGTELTALIKRAMRGNAQAFEQLVSAFSEDIYYNMLMCMDERCRSEAEDAAQEVIVVLYRNIGKLKSPRAFYSYLRSVIYNMAQRYNLKARRTQTEDVDEHEQAGHLRVSASELPEEEFEKKQTALLLAGYMEQLPAKQREALYLHYYRDLSYAEIAERLDVTTSTVGTNISKAKGALKKMLENDEGAQLKRKGEEPFIAEPSEDTPGTEKLAGFAAAPLIHSAVDQTMNQYAVSEHARNLAIHAQNLVSAHPEAIAAGTAVVAPRILKAAGAVIVAAGVAVGSFFGIQELNTCAHATTETVETTTVAEYNPQAEVIFVDNVDAQGVEGTDSEGTANSSDSNGEIEQDQAEHLNPSSATIVLDEGTASTWQVFDSLTGELVSEGIAVPADLTGLVSGEYTIVFDLVSPDGTIHASVQRGFTVQLD